MKIEQISCVIVKFNAILGVLTIYANYAFHSRQNSETFDVLHAFQSLVVAKLCDLKNSPGFFLAHPVYQKQNKLKKYECKSYKTQ